MLSRRMLCSCFQRALRSLGQHRHRKPDGSDELSASALPENFRRWSSRRFLPVVHVLDLGVPERRLGPRAGFFVGRSNQRCLLMPRAQTASAAADLGAAEFLTGGRRIARVSFDDWNYTLMRAPLRASSPSVSAGGSCARRVTSRNTRCVARSPLCSRTPRRQ